MGDRGERRLKAPQFLLMGLRRLGAGDEPRVTLSQCGVGSQHHGRAGRDIAPWDTSSRDLSIVSASSL